MASSRSSSTLSRRCGDGVTFRSSHIRSNLVIFLNPCSSPQKSSRLFITFSPPRERDTRHSLGHLLRPTTLSLAHGLLTISNEFLYQANPFLLSPNQSIAASLVFLYLG